MLVARRQAALDDVAATVASESKSVVLDLSEPGAAFTLAEATAGLEVGLLIYNAGADPYVSRFVDKPVEIWESMVIRNCATLVGTAHHFGALMAERGHGGIVAVTSGAAWAGGSHLAVYSASKAFDLNFGESLWAELSPVGVDVLAMVLGPTDTPAFRRVLNGRDFPGMADPEDVAREMLAHLADGPTFPPDPSPFGPVARRQAVELMSRGSASTQG